MTCSWSPGALCTLALLLLIAPAKATPSDSTFDEGHVPFAVQFGDKTIPYRIMAVTVRPDTSVRISAETATLPGVYRIDAPDSTIRSVFPSVWKFSAPTQPGLYPLTLTNTASGASVKIQVFVLRRWDHEGRILNGYRIGHYERDPRHGREVYELPSGFIRVTDENKEVLLSPHFRLEQFLCKQTDDTPQYALVQPRLLHQLERILAALNARGHAVPTLHVMSGYRTPQYNRAIGNTTEYSRHLYGDAADIYVDADGDRWMDDLTGDGLVTTADARSLAQIVRSVGTPGDDRFNGGLSVYGANAVHGPFVHIDLRGRRVRW